MSDSDSKHEQMLKKIQLWIAVLAGITTLVVGIYNVKNIFVAKEAPEPVKAPEPAPSAIRSAVEEVGASWIKELAAKRDKSN